VFQVAPLVVVLGLVISAIIGMAIGMVAGYLMTLILNVKIRTLWKDALLGSFGFFAGLIASAIAPWQTTVVTTIGDRATIQSSVDRYQHPAFAASAGALLLPVLHQLFRRYRMARSVSVSHR
jgi:hypothetical protein